MKDMFDEQDEVVKALVQDEHLFPSRENVDTLKKVLFCGGFVFCSNPGFFKPSATKLGRLITYGVMYLSSVVVVLIVQDTCPYGDP